MARAGAEPLADRTDRGRGVMEFDDFKVNYPIGYKFKYLGCDACIVTHYTERTVDRAAEVLVDVLTPSGIQRLIFTWWNLYKLLTRETTTSCV